MFTKNIANSRQLALISHYCITLRISQAQSPRETEELRNREERNIKRKQHNWETGLISTRNRHLWLLDQRGSWKFDHKEVFLTFKMPDNPYDHEKSF